MSVQANISDVIPCIYRFLAKNGFNEAAKAIKTKCDIDAKGGLSNIKLLKICKFYLKHHPELVKPEEEEEEEEEETPKVTKGKANGVQNGKRAAKKQVEEEEEEEEEEKPVTKKKVKTEAASTKSKKASKKMEEEEEEEEEEEKPTTKKGKTEASSTKQRKASKQESEEEEEEEVKPKSRKQSETAIKEKSASTSALNNRKSSKTIEEEEEEIVPQKHTGRFSYVDASVYEELPDHSKDMRFEAKSIFGNGGDAFGQYGNERLKDTRGKGFTKEKNKLKNKQFHGGSGRIDVFARNSIKFDDE